MNRVARPTQQSKELAEGVERLKEALYPPLHILLGWNYTPEKKREDLVRPVAEAARQLLPMLKLVFSDEGMAERAKKYVTKTRNFAKIVKALSGVSDWESLQQVVRDETTRSKSLTEKIREYSNILIQIVDALDIELETVLNIGGWRVLFSVNQHGEWTQELSEAVQYIVREATRILKSKGFGAYAQGQIWAYPTNYLPNAPALAMYQASTDTIWIAAAGAPEDVVYGLLHEVGHRVHMKALSSNARDEWANFFNSESGLIPNVDTIIKEWEEFTQSSAWAQKYGRNTLDFVTHLKKFEPEKVLWMEIIGRKLSKLDRSKPGLDLLIENKSQIKAFLHPVTSYSTVNDHELYAETFANYLWNGPQRIPEVVRVMFNRVTPMLKNAKTQKTVYSYDRRYQQPWDQQDIERKAVMRVRAAFGNRLIQTVRKNSGGLLNFGLDDTEVEQIYARFHDTGQEAYWEIRWEIRMNFKVSGLKDYGQAIGAKDWSDLLETDNPSWVVDVQLGERAIPVEFKANSKDSGLSIRINGDRAEGVWRLNAIGSCKAQPS